MSYGGKAVNGSHISNQVLLFAGGGVGGVGGVGGFGVGYLSGKAIITTSVDTEARY